MALDRQKWSEYYEAYRDSISMINQYTQQMMEDLKFYHGDQWSQEEKNWLSKQRRNALVFNKIKKIVNLISGYQRAYRMAYRVTPRELGATSTANQLTKSLFYIMNDCGGYYTLSNAFLQGPVKTGLSLVNLWLDRTEDPINGDLKLSMVPYSAMMIDPYFTKFDLSDCGFFGRRSWLSREQAKGLLPWAEKELEKIPKTNKDSMYPTLAAGKNVHHSDLHKYDEFWQQQHEKVKILVDPNTGEWREWGKGQEDRLKMVLQKMPNLKVTERLKRTVNLKIFIDENIMYDGKDPLGIDDYNFVPFVGYYDPEHTEFAEKIQGIIRPLRDPQTEANRRRSKMLDLIDSQINSGWKAEEDSVVNPESLYQSGQGKVVWTKTGKGAGVEKMPPGDIPQGMFRLASQMDQDIMDIGGVNEDMMGQAVQGEERSGVQLSTQRRVQGMTMLAELFDNYAESKRYLGEKLARAIQMNYTSAKIMHVTGEKPSAEFYNAEFGRYRVFLEEAVITRTQKQMEFQQLLTLKQLGAPVPWASVMQSAPIENKDELIKTVQSSEQAQQQQQSEYSQLVNAKAQEDLADAQESRTDSELNRAKTMKELDQIDEDRMLRLLEVAKDLSEAENEKPQQQDNTQTRTKRVTKGPQNTKGA